MPLVAPATPDLSTVYRNLAVMNGQANALAAATYILLYNSSTPQTLALGQSTRGGVPINPTELAVTGKTTKLSLYVEGMTNATAPTSTFDLSLVTLSPSSGTASNIVPTVASTLVSATSIVAPAANSAISVTSPDATLSTQGFYAVQLVITGSMAANSAVSFNVAVRARWV